MDYNKYYKKTKIERDHNIDISEATSIDKAIYILLLTALVIIPLFIKAYLGEFVSPSLSFLSTGTQADIFSYYKYIFLIIITILISVLFVYKVLFLQYNIAKSKVNLLLGILAVLVTLSAIFSPYKSIALHGIYNRHEGTITFICYLVLFFVAANMKYTVKQLQGFLYCLYPFVIINMVLGLAIFYEKNLLEVGWINNFILGSIPEEAQVSEGAKLWATVSNPNYISGIAGVLTVLFLGWAMFDKNKVRSSINIIISVLSFITVLTSLSTSGFLTLLAILPFIIIFIFINTEKKQSTIALVAFAVLATSVFVPLANKNSQIWDETFGFFLDTNPFEQKQVSMTSMEKNIQLVNEQSDLNILKPIVASAEDATDVKFSIPTLPESGISAGTGRYYEWKKTIEVSMKRPILGYGLDTFVYIFPQNDIEKKANLRKYETIVDKPHNMYLGLLVGSGILALISFILLLGSVFIKGIKVIFKRESPFGDRSILLATFLASLAYLIQAVFNDLVVGLGVIFWILLGVLLSLITRVKES